MQKSVYEYISKQTNDPIIEWKNCRISGTEFPIYQSDLNFYDKISPVIDGIKYSIPTPTLCPEERQRRRLSRRNERKLYKRTCDATGKSIISIYSPDKQYKVYDQKYWRNDSRDPLDYGKIFTTSKSFKKQLEELFITVPQLGTFLVNPENSDYTNGGIGNKDCYLIFLASHNESCLYARRIFDSKRIVDCEFCNACEESYSLINCSKCISCFFCEDSKNCFGCYNIKKCINCSYCINSENLENKTYYINNKQASKEEFDLIYQQQKKQSNTFNSIKKATETKFCDACVGSEIEEAKNSQFIFSGNQCNQIKYSYDFMDLQDSQDNNLQAYKSSLLYETVGAEKAQQAISLIASESCSNIYYSMLCFSCSYCFGCFGLRNKKYCILNKQYTKKEYEKLVPQIIEHMQKTGERGEFFDPQISPFGYNETVAQEYFPLTKEEAIAKGYTWSDYESGFPIVDGIIQGKDLPKTIQEVDDSILTRAIACEVTGKPFRIIKTELDFYRKHNIPLPHIHPDQRHLEKLAQRPARELHLRKCNKCGIDMISVYPENYEGKVYCESCYNKEIYG